MTPTVRAEIEAAAKRVGDALCHEDFNCFVSQRPQPDRCPACRAYRASLAELKAIAAHASREAAEAMRERCAAIENDLLSSTGDGICDGTVRAFSESIRTLPLGGDDGE